MSVPNVDVDLLWVLAATVVSFVIGALWYSVLFKKVWAREMGFDKKDQKKEKQKASMSKLMGINFVGTFIMTYVLAHFAIYLTAQTFFDALQLGLWVWLGFFASTTLLGSVLWEGKSWKLYTINASYWLVNLVVTSWILVRFG